MKLNIDKTFKYLYNIGTSPELPFFIRYPKDPLNWRLESLKRWKTYDKKFIKSLY